MKYKKNKIDLRRISIGIILAIIVTFSACLFMQGYKEQEATIVSHNVSLAADNFNVIRRLTVIDTRTDTIMLTMTGRMSISDDSKGVTAIVEVSKKDSIYQKHFIYTNDDTLVLVEDVTGANVSPYVYEVQVLPQTWIPVSIQMDEAFENAWKSDAWANSVTNSSE